MEVALVVAAAIGVILYESKKKKKEDGGDPDTPTTPQSANPLQNLLPSQSAPQAPAKSDWYAVDLNGVGRNANGGMYGIWGTFTSIPPGANVQQVPHDQYTQVSPPRFYGAYVNGAWQGTFLDKDNQCAGQVGPGGLPLCSVGSLPPPPA
jgi:hypothetical protein